MNGYNNGYTLFLPIETKGFLEPWLNSQFEDTESLFMMETPDNKNKSRTFVENIIKQLQLQSKATENNSMKQKLFKTSLNISDTFMKDPMVMYIGLRKWIAIERQLKKVPEVEYENYSHMFCLIQDVVTSVESNKDTLKKLNLFNNWLDDETSKKKSIMYQEQSLSLSLKVSDELKSIMKVTEDLLNRVIMFLKLWQNNEVGVRKGLLKSQTFALDIIQSWFEELADVLWNTRNHVSSLKTKEIAIHDELYRKVDNLLNQLIMHSFIVEEQPSLVLRTKTKLRVRCRVLIGKAQIASEFNSELSCTITVISENQAEKLKSFKSLNSEPKGDVDNNVKTIVFLESTNKRVVSFQEIKLDKMKRTTRTNTVNIADEKYAFVCKTSNLFQNGSRLKLLAVSLPFIAIVHGNQESQAWAAVLWDNLEIIPDSDLLNTPRVSWNNMAEQLSKKFDEIVKFPKKRLCDGSVIPPKEGRTLTEQNIRFLCFMAMNHSVQEEIPNDMSITWDAFFREKLPGRNFSFWDWFYSAIKLVESLSTYWNNSIIFGFIDKATAISQLESDIYQPGTFILRFSKTICGGLIATFKTNDHQIIHIYPYTIEDFKVHSFVNRMRDLTELKIIYPNFIRKCDILEEHPPMSTMYYNDYVKTVLVTSISYPSSSESSHNQYNLNYFPKSNCNNSNNFTSNIEQLNFNTNYQHCNVINNYQNCKNITSSIHDYNYSPSTSNFNSTESSYHDTSEYSSYETSDSSTESYYGSNAITFNIDSNMDYFQNL